MIDDDFTPDRLQIGAMGLLLVAHQNAPLLPGIREGELYRRMAGRYIGSERQPWLEPLAQHGLVKIVNTGFRSGDRVGESTFDICLTPAGVFYYILRANEVSAQAPSPLDHFPSDIVDMPWVIQSYYSSSDRDNAPTADGFVRFDHNESAYLDAKTKLASVYDALASDNEIGAEYPHVRDQKLDELKAIRNLLEKREGWQSKLLSSAFLTLCFISTTFASKPLGYLADQAWEAIQVMLGII